MAEKRKVILITDGDIYASKTIDWIAEKTGGYCVSASQGNPSTFHGEKLVKLILEAPREPVYVMFDDSGIVGEGSGEAALKYVSKHPLIEVLGVLAVAAKTHQAEWTKVDVSIDAEGELTEFGVDKEGARELEVNRMNGDTVYVLDQLNLPFVVGIGDIGKMRKKDELQKGSPITMKAIKLILERSGFHAEHKE